MERGGLRVYEQQSSIKVVGQNYIIEGILVVTSFNPPYKYFGLSPKRISKNSTELMGKIEKPRKLVKRFSGLSIDKRFWLNAS